MAQIPELEVLSTLESSVPASSGHDSSMESAATHHHYHTALDNLETVQILREWPVVTASVSKAQQLYRSLKESSGILKWSCHLAEKSVFALRDRFTNVLITLAPAIRIADLAASEVAEVVQKKLPVVRQPPSQVSQAVKSGVSGVFDKLVDKTESVVHNGKRQTRNAAKYGIDMYRKLVHSLDKWLDEMERYVDSSKSTGVKAAEMPEETSLTGQQISTRGLTRRALDAATNVVMFYVGASFCVLSRLPVIGKYLDQTASPASSKSTSPEKDTELQSSRSSESSSAASAATTTAAAETAATSLAAAVAAFAETMEQQRNSPLNAEGQASGQSEE